MDRNNEGLWTKAERADLESLVGLSERLSRVRAEAIHRRGQEPCRANNVLLPFSRLLSTQVEQFIEQTVGRVKDLQIGAKHHGGQRQINQPLVARSVG